MITKPLVIKRDGHWRIVGAGEELTEIPGYEDYYAVTRGGSVYSLPRTVTRKNGTKYSVPGRRLRPGITDGYWLVNLAKGSHRTKPVHLLVALTFIGPRPQGAQIRHLDGNRLNCHVDNLAYGTASENRYDSVLHGTHNSTRKTECKNGHPFDALTSHGTRRCRTCTRTSGAKYKARKKAEREAARAQA